ncbi:MULTISPECIES: hypothetical protein [unclassified Streptomyces]|uniref:hypothetical protein n=1 Tax=unclassified Streptomyces TaxID=2593676 RepID=UPI002E33A79C|nr:hypothetical protein [Streptomyces sp. NBC_01280]
MASGMGVTVVTQSSTITTSVLVPFAGAGILTPAQVYPVVVRSNLGTTFTVAPTAGSKRDEISVIHEGENSAPEASVSPHHQLVIRNPRRHERPFQAMQDCHVLRTVAQKLIDQVVDVLGGTKRHRGLPVLIPVVGRHSTHYLTLKDRRLPSAISVGQFIASTPSPSTPAVDRDLHARGLFMAS